MSQFQVGQRRRVLMMCQACDPLASMESRLSWHRAVESAREFDTWVICQRLTADMTPYPTKDRPHVPGLTICELDLTPWETWLSRTPGLYYSAYHAYQRRAFEHAQRLHRELKFDLVHQVSFCGFREPGYTWKLGIPFVWGPVGGTQDLPLSFLATLGWRDAVYEVSRSLLNYVHFRYRHRVRSAIRSAAHVWSATRVAQQHLADVHGRESTRQLETALSEIPPATTRLRRGQRPLRLIWAGRLCAWKGFPLLVRAMASIRDTTPVEVRVVGYGNRERECRRLVSKLGLSRQFDWLGWPPFHEQLRHFQWADASAFTSLRDTSGTGLLESLAHGCPIIGLDHQGARDIMSDDSSIKIAVTNPQQVIRDLAAAIRQLASDRELLERLSIGARRRAQDFLWADAGEQMRRVYWSILNAQSPIGTDATSDDMVTLTTP